MRSGLRCGRLQFDGVLDLGTALRRTIQFGCLKRSHGKFLFADWANFRCDCWFFLRLYRRFLVSLAVFLIALLAAKTARQI